MNKLFILILIANIGLYAGNGKPLGKTDNNKSPVTSKIGAPIVDKIKIYEDQPANIISLPQKKIIEYQESKEDSFDADNEFYYEENPQIGISFENLSLIKGEFNEINYIKLTWNKSAWYNISLQMSGGIGLSDRLEKNRLSNIINGRIKAINMGLSVKYHYPVSTSSADFYFIFGFHIEVLKWKYKESFESVYLGDSYFMETEDRTTGIGLSCGGGIASVPIGNFKFGLEAAPGIIFIAPRTQNEFENLLSSIFFLRLAFYINYETESY